MESAEAPAEQKKSGSHVARGTAIVSSLTLVSRVLGAVRDLLVARLFGDGKFADSFFVAFRIPNLLRSFVAEGALTSAFVPVFAQELARGHEAAYRTIRHVTSFLLLIGVTLSVLGIFFAREIVVAFAPGFTEDPAQLELCILLTRIMLPYVICVSLVAMLNGALNSIRIFGAGAWAQVVMNLVLIAGALVAGWSRDPTTAALLLAGSVVLGGLAQVVAQLPALWRSKFSILPAAAFWSAPVRGIAVLMLPALVGATVYQLMIFVNTMFASLQMAGSVSWLFYADRIVQLPLGIFSIALASVLLPTLAAAQATKADKSFASNLSDSLRYTSFIIIPFSAWLFCAALPVTVVLFERGAFDHRASEMTALAIQALGLGIWQVSCHSMITRAFIARKDTVTPTLLGIGALVVNVTMGLWLMGAPSTTAGLGAFVRHSQETLGTVAPLFDWGHVGLSFASTVSSSVMLLVAWLLVSRRLTDADWTPFVRASWQSIVASAAAFGCAECAMSLVSDPFASTFVSLAIFGSVFPAVAYALKSRELREVGSVGRRLAARIRRSRNGAA